RQAVAGKDQRGLHVPRGETGRDAEVTPESEGRPLPTLTEAQRHAWRLEGHLHEAHPLEPAVAPARTQTNPAELLRNVARGLLVARCPGIPSAEGIVGEHLDVAPPAIGRLLSLHGS
ncbi:MAG: hypothetical protein ACK55I_29235, partial [bacterium]